MVDPHECPVCYQVFEGAIYQCSPEGGHVVCSSCFGKLKECPVCREEFSIPKIRCRALEHQLDSQEFECQFKNEGCDYKCKRALVSSHINSCGFNPKFTNLCNLLGWNECKFLLGACSKTQIIQHFKEKHNLDMDFDAVFSLDLQSIVNSIKDDKRNGCLALLFASSSEDMSPVFLLVGKVNDSIGFVTFLCIKIWESEGISQAYKVDFSIRRKHSLLLNWTLNVYTLQEAKHTLEMCPVNIPKGILENGLFGSNKMEV
ncbi:unnamed protein product [Orchesella dallaii]|uniref:RING-type domain-containing protein n=1 Tax=Orchesella dallaii TaxID=48710 RepID=A0ABP1R7Z5_9HEXA